MRQSCVTSIINHFLTNLWDQLKQLIVLPVPKVSPPQQIHSDLHPISFTNSVAKILAGFTNRRFVHQLEEYTDHKQFARKGQSTSHALVYLLQAIHEANDCWNSCVWIFFSNFSKGFDITDHHILVDELSLLGVDPVLSDWIVFSD